MAEIDWAKLRAPIPAEHIKQVNKGYGNRSYVDAPALMERLDDVLGPDGWMEDTTVEWHGDYPSAKCKLSIAVNGDWITKSGMGGPNNVGRSTSESGRVNSEGKPLKDGRLYVEDEEPDKSAASDAFRRACRTWGIGRELWLGGKGTQASQEGRSAPATGGIPTCGLCGAPGVVRDGVKGKFWGCSKYHETKCKGKFPKYLSPEDQALLESQPPDPESEDDLTTVDGVKAALVRDLFEQGMTEGHDDFRGFMHEYSQTHEVEPELASLDDKRWTLAKLLHFRMEWQKRAQVTE